jgi:methanogenic corrinoid protein MtbC1
MDKRAQDLEQSSGTEPAFVGVGGASQPRRETTAELPKALEPLLAGMVTNHIIPRLILAHSLEVAEFDLPTVTQAPPTPREVEEFAELAVAMETMQALEQVESRLRAGAAYEGVLLDLVGGAAHMLGEQWTSDHRTFAEVTIGLATLHRVVAMLRHRLKPPVSARGVVILLAAPGEQHTLAIHVLGDLLIHAGWDADVWPVFHEAELVATVATEPIVMVGISVNSAEFVAPLAPLIARLRAASLNRDLTVMLGGAVDLSSYATDIGAVFCADARRALSWLDCYGRVAI